MMGDDDAKIVVSSTVWEIGDDADWRPAKRPRQPDHPPTGEEVEENVECDVHSVLHM